MRHGVLEVGVRHPRDTEDGNRSNHARFEHHTVRYRAWVCFGGEQNDTAETEHDHLNHHVHAYWLSAFLNGADLRPHCNHHDH
ncbi:Uncharacterised protein [Vibrio cholerae]|uniref:Uncharacterized protein n=1 Tax=Vibrio cholerae TaxID=666 RepID=A0A656AH26_VIBCL|nr:Uncharacterised protein [Vibrio cholerae]CSC24839.1 Uncharacterised protein [Vibrio cholerae]CSD09739.1 Uncharacterised protein [Vibrio cholerae]CSI48164.1 Uncharacterised protein [Vibrio cholerae]CSI56379.1 Uncharacterised protein [Vibrio cholerae]